MIKPLQCLFAQYCIFKAYVANNLETFSSLDKVPGERYVLVPWLIFFLTCKEAKMVVGWDEDRGKELIAVVY